MGVAWLWERFVVPEAVDVRELAEAVAEEDYSVSVGADDIFAVCEDAVGAHFYWVFVGAGQIQCVGLDTGPYLGAT